jgi:hypothetical protein
MITFEITQKPIRSLMTVQDIEVVVGAKYNIALESQIKIENQTDFFGEPFDSFKYKIHNEDVVSVNEGNVVINFETNKTQTPDLINIIKNLRLQESFLFSSEVTSNQYYDRIIITNISGKGSWFYNSNIVNVGDVFFNYNLFSNLYFVSDDLGIEDNYNEINWQTGTILETHSGVNSLIVNTFSDGAELTLESFNGPSINELGVEKYTYFVNIKAGMTNAVYKINIDATGFIDIGGDEIIELNERDLPLQTINTLEVIERISNLDSNGQTSYVISISKLAVTTVINNVVLTLTEVAGTSDNVNPLNTQITLIIPITPTP